jgi:hypothetical protein
MRTAVSDESVVCANCGARFTAPTHSGRYRQTSERRIKSARYCSPACRQAAYVARRAARADVPQLILLDGDEVTTAGTRHRSPTRWRRSEPPRPYFSVLNLP